jgi:tetratricopeptide (TPR) repeat protein
MVEYQFFNLNPTVYHYTNLFLHIINAILVFVLIWGLSGSYLTSLLVGLLFAVHPMRVESVAWIAERKDVLSSFFYFLSLIFYVQYIKEKNRRFYWFCMSSLVLSLLSKPMAVSQPFILLLIDYVSNKKLNKEAVLNKIPFFAISAVFIAITFLTQITGSESEHIRFSIFQQILVPFYGIVFYLFKSVFPVNLCALYPYSVKLDGGIPLRLLASPFLVIGIAAMVWHFRTKSRKLVFGSLFFLITALPVLQIVPVGRAIVADRYTYIPMLGIYFIFASFYGFLLREKFSSKNAVKVLLLLCVTIPLSVFACMAYERCGVWKDSLSLWNDVVSKHPVAFAYNNRAKFYAAQGDYDNAIEDINRAISLNPTLALPYYNRAIIYRNRGEYDSAIADNTRAILYSPKYIQAYNDRGVAYCYKGDYDRGIEDFTQAIMLNPKNAEAYYNRGVAYFHKGDYGHSIEDFTLAIRLNPQYMDAYDGRGLVYEAKGDNNNAMEDFRKACDLGFDPACQQLRGN